MGRESHLGLTPLGLARPGREPVVTFRHFGFLPWAGWLWGHLSSSFRPLQVQWGQPYPKEEGPMGRESHLGLTLLELARRRGPGVTFCHFGFLPRAGWLWGHLSSSFRPLQVQWG